MTSNPSMENAFIPGVPHRWTALSVALTAIGFVVFWPLGLAMVVYVLWGEKIAACARGSEGAFDRFRKTADDFGRSFRADFGSRAGGFAGFGRRTGNAAFDAWRDAQLSRLAEERRKVDEITEAFEAHLRAARGAHDEARQREEFETFMANRRA